MANNKSNALMIISLVIGAFGVGLGTFSIIRYEIIEGPEGPQGLQGDPGVDGINGTDGDDGVNGTLNNLVGIWESVGASQTGTVFNLTFGNIQLNNSEYFTLSSNQEIIYLDKPGWYRVNVRIRLTGLVSTADYYLVLIGYVLEYLDNIPYPQETEYSVNTFGYIHSDGDKYFILHCYNWDGDTFSVDTDQDFNQIVLEYVGES